MNLLVTSVNRPPAYSVGVALRHLFPKVYGTSTIPLGPASALSTRLERIVHLPPPSYKSGVDSPEALEYVAALISIAKRHDVTTIWPCQDVEILTLSRHEAKLREAGIQPLVHDWDTLQVAMDKDRTAQVAMQVGFPCPRTREFDSEDDAVAIAHEFAYPLVLKATPAMAASGVRMVNDQEELKREIRSLCGKFQTVLLQEYIPGNKERSINLLLDGRGELVTAFGLKKFHYVHPSWSTAIETFDLPAAVHDKAVDLVSALNLKGFVAIQTKIDQRDGRYKLIEVNPRFGNNSRLFRSSLGVNLPALHLSALRGKAVGERSVGSGKCGVSIVDDLMAMAVFVAKRYEKRTGASRFVERFNPVPTPAQMIHSYIRLYGRRPGVDDYARALVRDPVFALGFLYAVLRLESTPPQHWNYFIPWGEVTAMA